MAADYDTLVYTEVGGSKLVVADGGEIEVQSGATLDIQDGATFNVDVLTVTDVVTVGEFDSVTAGSGIPLSSAATAAFRVYADDGGVAITSANEKAILSRFLITVSPGDCTLEGILGQIKYASGVHCSADYQSGIRGYLELVGGNTVNTGGANANIGAGASAIRAMVDVDANTTIATNHYMCGYQAQLRVKPTFSVTQNGVLCAYGVFADDQSGGATPTDKWGYGLYIPDGVADTGIGIGDCTTAINVTAADRVLLGGGYSTADNLPMTTDNHYLVGIFGKMAATEDITLEQRVILGRLGVVAGVTIGSAAGWGQGMSGVKGHIAFYGGSTTETYCWHNAGVFGHIQADGVAKVYFKDGSHTACFYGHAGLVAAQAARTYVDSGAVVAGIALHSGIGASINNSGTIAGVYIYKDTVGNLDWPIGIDINNSTTGMDIGACTTGITFTGAQTTAVDISATGLTDGILIDGLTPVDGIHVSSNCTGAALNITGTTSDAGILVGANGTELIRTSDSHYSVGIFTKINADEDITRTLRGLWSRFAVPANVQIGSVDGWGEGINAIEGNVKLYGGALGTYTQIYCWQIAGVWAMLETDNTDHILFEGGSHAAGLFAHIELGSGAELTADSAAAAVVAFSNSHASADITNGDYVGVLVDKESAKLSFQVGLKIEDGCSTTGIDIGDCTTGIDFTNTGADGPYWAVKYGEAFGAAKALTGLDDATKIIPISVSITTTGTGTGIASAGYFKADAISGNQLRIVAGLSASAAHAVNILAAVGISAEIRRGAGGGTTEVGCDSAAAWTSAIMGASTDRYAGRLWSVFGQLSTFGQTSTNPSSAYSGVAGFHGYAKSNSVMQLRQFGGGTLVEAMLHMEATGASTVPVGILLEGGTWTIGMDFADVCTTAIDIGSSTTGISFTGTCDDGIKFETGATMTDAIDIADVVAGWPINISGTQTAGLITGTLSTTTSTAKPGLDFNWTSATTYGSGGDPILGSGLVEGFLQIGDPSTAVQYTGIGSKVGLYINADVVAVGSQWNLMGGICSRVTTTVPQTNVEAMICGITSYMRNVGASATMRVQTPVFGLRSVIYTGTDDEAERQTAIHAAIIDLSTAHTYAHNHCGLEITLNLHTGTHTVGGSASYGIHFDSEESSFVRNTALMHVADDNWTSFVDFDADGACGGYPAKVGVVCQTNSNDSDGAIRINIDDVAYWIPVYDADKVTGE